MATASRILRNPVAPLVVIAALVIAVATWASTRTNAPADTREPLRVRATSVYDFSSLDEMGAASDLVVEADVVAVERGRLVGEPDEGGVISRIVTLAVADVIRGGATTASTLIVEEEGWLPDGTPIIVDDVEPSVVGDHGVWFLDELEAPDDADVPVYLVINSQGRMLERDGGVVGGDQTDPLVRTVQQQAYDELIRALKATTSSTPP
ncbi:MAG TPA: hypothetical protein VNO51_14105 [Ilumatobacteraceae bacterium]|nr:hypothetical protein [Ilumatobacteraceae bacterium]